LRPAAAMFHEYLFEVLRKRKLPSGD